LRRPRKQNAQKNGFTMTKTAKMWTLFD